MYIFALPFTFNMQQKVFAVFTQYVILCPALIKALIGEPVRSVQLNEYSAVVCLSKYRPEHPLTHTVYCSGIIMYPNHILTAEDCLQNLGNNALQVIVGNGDVAHGTCTFPVWWISYDAWAHQRHVQVQTQHNNIAIVKLVGELPNVRRATLTPFTPLNLIEGLHVKLYGCSPLDENINDNMVKTARVGVFPRQVCNAIVTQLEGQQLAFPDNYICSMNMPYAQLQEHDMGGPVIFSNAIIGVSIGVFPHMGGEFDEHKVNAHIGIDVYRHFIYATLLEH